MFNLNSNVIFINPCFYSENGEPVNSFVVEKSEFTAKSNGVDLVAETLFTVADPKKGKKSAIAKIITPKETIESNATVEYAHTNKYVEKYKNINTTLNLLDANAESDGRKYIVVAVPFNGTITDITVTGSNAEVVSAQYNSTQAVKFNTTDKLLYGKIFYLIIKVAPSSTGFEDVTISFTAVSSKKNSDTTYYRVSRFLNVTIPTTFITETTEESKYVLPVISGSETDEAAPLDDDGRIPTPEKRFNELFDIKIDKTVKNYNNGEYHKKSSYFTKKNDDIVTNFFNNDAYTEKPMSKKFNAAKKRYAEYDDE